MEKEVTDEVINAVDRNVSHLELQMGKEHITGAGEDLSDVEAAILLVKHLLRTQSLNNLPSTLTKVSYSQKRTSSTP